MPPTLPPTTNLGGPDTTTATEFLNDLMRSVSALWVDQVARVSNIFTRMREGSYTSTELQMDLARMWDPWIAMATFPLQWWSQYSRVLPTLLFVVDPVAETVGPLDAPVTVSLPAGLTLQVDDLHPVGNSQSKTLGGPGPGGNPNPKLDKKHIQAEFSPEGNRILVRLVDLGSGAARKLAGNDITPGFYVGPVYVTEVATRRPLAILYVLVE
jgi:hypothetical protein